MTARPDRQLVAFFLLTWAISWPVWYLSGVLTRGADVVCDGRWLVSQIGVFAPAFSALIVSGFQSEKNKMNALRILPLFVLIFAAGFVVTRIAPRSIHDFTPHLSIIVIVVGITSLMYFSPLNGRLLMPATGQPQPRAGTGVVLLAALGVPALFLVGWFIVNLQGDSWSVTSLHKGPNAFSIALATSFCLNTILGGSVGEELGWRGFALPLLLKRYSPLRASLGLGLIWALWHLPIDVSGAILPAPEAVILRIAWTLPLSIIFTWFYLITGGNLFTAILLHTAINILPDLGFSRYESSIAVLTVSLIAAAVFAASRQIMRNQRAS